jgi:hypothetical protein
MLFTGCQEANQKVAGHSRLCSICTRPYMDKHIDTMNTSKHKDRWIVSIIETLRINVYVGCNPHDDLVAAEETTKVLPRYTRLKNIFDRKTWQEFKLSSAFWETLWVRM